MHRTNGDSFPQMAALAEEYQVRGLVVMVFKSDAENQRNSIPSKEQMQKTAGFIRNYKGPVELEAEDCFSQMRALMGQRFFGNRNRGLGRGCGAGSDGVSVQNCDYGRGYPLQSFGQRRSGYNPFHGGTFHRRTWHFYGQEISGFVGIHLRGREELPYGGKEF